MGFHLFYEVTNNAPLSWTQPMMHVAQVIAMDASDKTRKSWINQADLIRKTRFESWDGVGKILKKLASSGYEFRVPVCTDKNGKVMYAKRGYALNYLVPVMSPTEFGRPGGRANYEVSPVFSSTSGGGGARLT
jgi:hypothetical protein